MIDFYYVYTDCVDMYLLTYYTLSTDLSNIRHTLW